MYDPQLYVHRQLPVSNLNYYKAVFLKEFWCQDTGNKKLYCRLQVTTPKNASSGEIGNTQHNSSSPHCFLTFGRLSMSWQDQIVRGFLPPWSHLPVAFSNRLVRRYCITIPRYAACNPWVHSVESCASQYFCTSNNSAFGTPSRKCDCCCLPVNIQ